MSAGSVALSLNAVAADTAPGDAFALRRLVDASAIAMDRRDWDLYVSLFLPTGTLERVGETPGDAAVFRLVGREEIRTLADRVSRHRRTFHFIGNYLCSVNDDDATGIAYVRAHHLDDVESGQIDETALNWYEDEYQRTPDGWRIRSRAIHRAWSETLKVG
jgi:hypothetical protein